MRFVDDSFNVMRATYPFANNPYLQETVENLQPAMSRAYFLALEQRKASMSEYLELFERLLAAVIARDFRMIRDVLTAYAPAQLRSGDLCPDGRYKRAAKVHQAGGLQVLRRPDHGELPQQHGGGGRANGCGKSNIIDAVRWVMGESSAKNLRGESMTDVIFNGSTSRKPVSQASIELVFDNADGTLLGEYAAYAEISIRRKVTRDSQTTYYLNGTKCRRRDITDIFLGTGLGPRSYSIIEQGMISKLIEARGPAQLHRRSGGDLRSTRSVGAKPKTASAAPTKTWSA